MKEEIKKNKGVKNLGPLNLELVKKLSEQMGNNEDSIEEPNQLNPERTKQLEALAEYSKGLQADEHWRSAALEAMQDPFHNIKIEHTDPVKPIKPVDFNFLELTINQIKELPTEELHKFLSGESHSGLIRESTIQLIINEILSRQIKEASKPHWTVYLGVILALIAAITGIIQLIK